MTHLDLNDTEADALATLLTRAIDGDRYPLSPRVQTLKDILAKLRPAATSCDPSAPAAAQELRATVDGPISRRG